MAKLSPSRKKVLDLLVLKQSGESNNSFANRVAPGLGIKPSMILYHIMRINKEAAKRSSIEKAVATRAAHAISKTHVGDINLTSGTEIKIGDVIIRPVGNSITINGTKIEW